MGMVLQTKFEIDLLTDRWIVTYDSSRVYGPPYPQYHRQGAEWRILERLEGTHSEVYRPMKWWEHIRFTLGCWNYHFYTWRRFHPACRWYYDWRHQHYLREHNIICARIRERNRLKHQST